MVGVLYYGILYVVLLGVSSHAARVNVAALRYCMPRLVQNIAFKPDVEHWVSMIVQSVISCLTHVEKASNVVNSFTNSAFSRSTSF